MNRKTQRSSEILVTRKQAAQRLAVSLRTIATLIKRKKLRTIRIGNRVLIPSRAVDGYIDAHAGDAFASTVALGLDTAERIGLEYPLHLTIIEPNGEEKSFLYGEKGEAPEPLDDEPMNICVKRETTDRFPLLMWITNVDLEECSGNFKTEMIEVRMSAVPTGLGGFSFTSIIRPLIDSPKSAKQKAKPVLAREQERADGDVIAAEKGDVGAL